MEKKILEILDEELGADSFREESRRIAAKRINKLRLTTEDVPRCCDCGAELKDGFTTRCYNCWDDIYFPK